MVATAGSRKRTKDAAPEQVEPTARHLAVRRHDIPSAATGGFPSVYSAPERNQ